MNLSEQTPTQIDTALADLYHQINRVRSERDSIYRHIASEIAWRVYNRGGRRSAATAEEVRTNIAEWTKTPKDDLPFYAPNILGYWNDYQAKHTQMLAVIAEKQPYDEEFINRGGWSRFFLAQATNGHIHSSMDCSTCNNGKEPTLFAWLPDLSGQTEKEAVADQGPLLCTTCFPSAPTEWTNYYEKQAEEKKAAQCPGSGTWDYPEETARKGYYTGNYGVCSHCDQQITLTKTNKLRGHKPAA